LAGLAGLDRTYVSSLERGRYNASIKTIDLLARALKTHPRMLLDDADEPQAGMGNEGK